MKRIYEPIIEQHFNDNDQMLFLAGPRQVGKTTITKEMSSKAQSFCYLNFDVEKDRQIILQGEDAILNSVGFHRVQKEKPLLILDEFHKYKHWKNFLKGFYDQYKSKLNIIVTGSAKLNIYQKGGDSLMGRYLLYRIHPLSVSELLKRPLPKIPISSPKPLESGEFGRLFELGGYPEPFIKNNERFSKQWRQRRRRQLFSEEIRDLRQVQDIPHIEMLANLIREHAGQQMNYSALAKAIRVSVDTVRRWLNILEEFYFSFRVRPWYTNVKRSLVKEPKVYLWDWAEIKDPGARLENFVASHLHKAVHFWTDYGFGEFGLHYLRDKERREVDFLITRDNEPWFMVEVKNSNNNALNKNLYYFQKEINVQHAFQLVMNLPYVDKNCFDYTEPVIAPLITFLSQLI